MEKLAHGDTASSIKALQAQTIDVLEHLQDLANAASPTATNDGPRPFFELPQVGSDVGQAPDPQTVPEGPQRISLVLSRDVRVTISNGAINMKELVVLRRAIHSFPGYIQSYFAEAALEYMFTAIPEINRAMNTDKTFFFCARARF